MKRHPAALGGLLLLTLGGCNPAAVDAPPPAPTEVRRPAESSPRALPAPVEAGRAKVSSDETDRDRAFAAFLRTHSGGMIQEAAVGIERRGVLRVKLDKSVTPDDTLELTKSLMSGARKDFPDRPFKLRVYDPAGELILTAHHDPAEGVRYQIAGDATSDAHPGSEGPETTSRPARPPSGDATARQGGTANDRKFAAWAEDHGKKYLRYVEADLEKHGRLWFGVTREVKPEDVKDLTRSLLEGAQKEFPRRDLVATVFDPNGERIGRAHLGSGGDIRWER